MKEVTQWFDHHNNKLLFIKLQYEIIFWHYEKQSKDWSFHNQDLPSKYK